MKKIILALALLTPELSFSEVCTEQSGAYYMAKRFVTRALKSPSTADFPSSREADTIYLGGCVYTVVGYVDAQNAFGATIRNYFFIAMKHKESDDTWRRSLGPTLSASRGEVVLLAEQFRQGYTRKPKKKVKSDLRLKRIQILLREWGLATGPADGLIGEKTRRAIRNYQELKSLPITGEPSDELLKHIENTVNTIPK